MLTALLTAHALRARLQTSSAMDCNGLLRFKAGARVMLSAADAASSAVSMGTPEICDLLASSGTNALADGTCTRLPSTHDQMIPWCLQRGLKAHPLFALGPHAALGAVFDSAFALRNENVPAWLNEEELRISVHIRHFDDGSLGSEPLGAFEAAIRDAVAAASAKRCALLVASDRRLTLHLMQDVARRIGCRLATSARRAPTRDYSVEHGEDTGAVLLQDVFLLARGHVLIGSWGSTLTLLIRGHRCGIGLRTDRNLLPAALQPVAMHATAAAADERAQSVVGVHRLERQGRWLRLTAWNALWNGSARTCAAA